jgi:hypothetical protein
MKRVVLYSMAVVGLMACGPGAKVGGGKQGAAEALFAASRPTKSAADKSATPADIGTITYNCPQGGSAELSAAGASISIGGTTSVGLKLNLKYNNCGLATSDVGTAVYNGTMVLTQSVKVASSAVSIEQQFVGKVNVQGAFDDYLDANVKQIIEAAALESSASVAMTLQGTISTSSGTYTFDEAVNVTAGKLTVEVKSTK